MEKRTEPGAAVYTDEVSAYEDIPNHASVRHGAAEFVRGEVHTQGIESFWSMLKRAHKGIYHKMSPKHLDRYVDEFAGRHNMRPLGTLDQMGLVARGLEGKRLAYAQLKEDNGLDSFARETA